MKNKGSEKINKVYYNSKCSKCRIAKDYLENNKVATRMLFGGNITRQPAYKGKEYRIVSNLKNTDLVMKNGFWIGVYPGLSSEKISYVIEKFEDFFKDK